MNSPSAESRRSSPSSPAADFSGSSSRDVEQQQQQQQNPQRSYDDDKEQDLFLRYGLRRPTHPVVRRILMFAPPWFTLTMGTGILSVVLHQLPYQFHGLGIIADLFFVLNLVLFLLFTLTMLVRWLYWPPLVRWTFAHPNQSFYYAAFSISLATLVNFVVITLPAAWGSGWVTFAWVLWWIDAVVSVFSNIGILFSLFAFQDQTFANMNGMWMLPAIACIVSSASGGLVASSLPAHHARLTVAVSYVLLGTGLPTSLLIMASYMARLALHKLPAPQGVFTVFVPVSPCGMGSYSVLILGKAVRHFVSQSQHFWGGGGAMYSASQAEMFASAIYGCSIPLALALWGSGFFWFVVAVLALAVQGRRGIPFTLSYWAMIFPVGAWTLATIQLSTEMDSTAFKVISCVQCVVLVVVWLALVPPTAWFGYTGRISSAPDLGELQKKL